MDDYYNQVKADYIGIQDCALGGGGGGGRRYRYCLSYEYAIYTAENHIISKSKVLILKYLVFIKLHYYYSF